MRERLEMFTATLMQNMVQIRKRNTYFVTELFFRIFEKSSFVALEVEKPHGGAMFWQRRKPDSHSLKIDKLVRLCGPQHI